MGECSLLNISKEDLQKAKEVVKKPENKKQPEQTKSRSFMDWLGEHREVGQDIDNQVEQVVNPDSTKGPAQLTKIIVKKLANDTGEEEPNIIDACKFLGKETYRFMKETSSGLGHAFSKWGLNPKVPQRDPRAL